MACANCLSLLPADCKAAAAVEKSMMYGRASIKHHVPLDQHRHYQSFYEAQQVAEDDLDRVTSRRFAEEFASQEELTQSMQNDLKDTSADLAW